MDNVIMNPKIIGILTASLLVSVPVCANAQDFDSSETLKSDISKPELISMPPMDPFSVSFTPPKPDEAMD